MTWNSGIEASEGSPDGDTAADGTKLSIWVCNRYGRIVPQLNNTNGVVAQLASA